MYKKLLIWLFVVAVCTEWTDFSFKYGITIKCEDENVVCYQAQSGNGVAMQCFQKKVANGTSY